MDRTVAPTPQPSECPTITGTKVRFATADPIRFRTNIDTPKQVDLEQVDLEQVDLGCRPPTASIVAISLDTLSAPHAGGMRWRDGRSDRREDLG